MMSGLCLIKGKLPNRDQRAYASSNLPCRDLDYNQEIILEINVTVHRNLKRNSLKTFANEFHKIKFTVTLAINNSVLYWCMVFNNTVGVSCCSSVSTHNRSKII